MLHTLNSKEGFRSEPYVLDGQTLAGSFHYSGLEPNYIDVGGADIARIKGFLNTYLWGANVVLALAVAQLRLATGQWAMIFLLPPTLQLGTATVYLQWAAATPYRQYRKKRAVAAALLVRVRDAAAKQVAEQSTRADADNDTHGSTPELRKLSREARERQMAAHALRAMRRQPPPNTS